MRFGSVALLVWLFAVASPQGLLAGEDSQRTDFFERKIRPVLAKHCYECHSSGNKVKGGLLLDSERGWQKGGDSGPVITPGKPAKSLLLEALQYESLEMPPSGKLPDSVIADFAKWIGDGAPDPRGEPVPSDDRHTYEPVSPDELWSLQPVEHHGVPQVSDETWPLSDIDRFVLARLDDQNLVPVSDAPGHRLIRRVHLDLTGLPPSPDAIEHWLAEFGKVTNSSRHTNRQQLLLRLVDELLESPQYGERWGRHWLDTARYAESNGSNRNRVYRYAWRYRNWVIDAVSEDKPYDQFLKEQLAGDLMPADSKLQRDKQRIATGFLAIGPKPYYPTIVPFDPDEPDRARYDWAAEQIEATTSGMLGLTVGCARCHDHKFDPIPTRDYYALAGIFRSTNPRFGMFWDLFGVDEGKAQRDFLYDFNLLVLNDEILKKIEPLQAQYKPLVIEENRIDLRRRHWPEQIERMEARLGGSEELPDNVVADLERNIDKRRKQLAEDEKRLVEVLRLKQELKEAFNFAVDQAMGVEDAEQPADVELRIDGEHAKRGPIVPRGFLSTVEFQDAPGAINPKQSGRLELVNWIAHPNNPLTARVAVNRIWYHLFGRGIVGTLDNFGSAGETPSHPKLLDHLAHKFVHEFGWSQKRMIRYLVSSRVYQLDSSESEATRSHFETDPDNTLFWRMSPRRLEAEVLRDSMLAVAGRLKLERPTRSPLVGFDYYADIRHGDRIKAIEMLASDLRTIYVPTLRGHRHPLYDLFDYPDDEAVNSARNISSVPTQALYLMNNPLVMDYAAAMVERLEKERLNSDAEQLERIYRLCFGRPPTKDELHEDLQFLKDQQINTNVTQAWRRLAQSFLISGEFLFQL